MGSQVDRWFKPRSGAARPAEAGQTIVEGDSEKYGQALDYSDWMISVESDGRVR